MLYQRVKSCRALIKMVFMETIKSGRTVWGYFIVIISLVVITQNKLLRRFRKLTADQLLCCLPNLWLCNQLQTHSYSDE